MTGSLEGRIALVTGAGRGIGRAVAHHLARCGADVIVTDLDLSGDNTFGEEIAEGGVSSEIEALGRRSLAFETDLSDRERVSGIFAEIEAKLGPIDVLVNNAGGAVSPFETSSASLSPLADFTKVFAANYLSTVNCSQEAVAQMRKAGKGGSIVNIGSLAHVKGGMNGSLAYYGSAKAGVITFARALAGEVGRDGIRVNTINCGTIATPRIKATAKVRSIGTDEQLAMIDLGRFGEPEDVANVAEFFASDQSAYVTGQTLNLNGGGVY